MEIQDVKKRNKLLKYLIGIISDVKNSVEIMNLRVFQACFQNYSRAFFNWSKPVKDTKARSSFESNLSYAINFSILS